MTPANPAGLLREGYHVDRSCDDGEEVHGLYHADGTNVTIGNLRAALAADEPGLDVRLVKQAIVNIAKRHGIAPDEAKSVDTYSVATIFGYSKTTPDMDAEIAAEYARLSGREPEGADHDR